MADPGAAPAAPVTTQDDPQDIVALRVATLQSDRVSGTLRAAAALASVDRTIDLCGLDEDIGRLCAGALDLSSDQRHILLPRLKTLLADIDALYELLDRR